MNDKIYDKLKFLVEGMAAHKLLIWLPDKVYLKLIYRVNMRKPLNLKNPQTYNEKLQWLKLYNRRPEYTNLVDKYAVRDYVSKKIGTDYLIPLLGVWENVDKINFESLPEQFVLKCNHDSGGLIICKDKSSLDVQNAEKFLKKKLKRNYYWMSREWPYKNIKRKIIAEKYMVDESGYELKDYKFFCFDGECKAIFIASNRGVDTRFDFFDREFNHLPFKNGHENADQPLKKPKILDEMIIIAEKLSVGIPQVRVDLYDVLGKIYFGEMTFFHWGGKKPFEPEEWDYTFGSWIKLPNKKSVQ